MDRRDKRQVGRKARSVIVVDDEADVLDIICDALEDEGFQVLCFDQPTHAVVLGATQQPCLFLLDLMLPDLDGIALAQRLRTGPFPTTPLVAMSAFRMMLERAKHSHLFQDILAKPFELDELVRNRLPTPLPRSSPPAGLDGSGLPALPPAASGAL